jgi:hypothetical protein
MDKVIIEITKDEAALLPLLYKVPVNVTLEAAAQVMKYRMTVDELLKKVQAAFEEKPEGKE